MKTPLLLSLLFIFSSALLGQDEAISVPETQKSLITKRTATWCPNCADESAWDLKNRLIIDLADQALVISGHHSTASRLHSPAAKDLIDNFQRTFSQPVFFFNTETVGNGGAQTEDLIKQKVNDATNQRPSAQTGLRVFYDEAQNLLEVQTRSTFFDATIGDYFLGLYLVEKSVIETQSALSSEADHKNVLREAISDGSFGEVIANGFIDASSNFDAVKQYQFSEAFPTDNFMVAAILWKKDENEVYEFVNLNTSDEFLTQIVSRTYGIKALNQYQIQPTITQSYSQAIIDLEQPLQNATLKIYNWQGQLLQQVFQGNLSAGIHQFKLQVEQAGTYLVTLQSGQQMSTQRLIKVD
ncbi:MAG: T9SS type A sorting domain-containing protein [Bacteroidota bacterium]